MSYISSVSATQCDVRISEPLYHNLSANYKVILDELFSYVDFFVHTLVGTPHTLFLRMNSKRVDPILHLTLLGKTSYVCCAAFDDTQWTMNESAMTGNPTPVSGKPWQGRAMGGMAYGHIDWEGTGGN